MLIKLETTNYIVGNFAGAGNSTNGINRRLG